MMGGLATAVAAGLVSILLLQCFAIYMTATLNVSSSEIGAASDQAALASSTLNQRVQVDSVNVVNGTYVLLDAQNTGGTNIQVANLGQLDIILVGTMASNESAAALWIPYSSARGQYGWTVVSATTADGGPKLIDPINYPYPTYGVWDPSDIIQIGLSLAPSDALNSTAPVSVLIATPAGTTTVGGS